MTIFLGDLSAAIEFLEKFFTLTTDQDWQNKEGEHLHDNAAIQVDFFLYPSLFTVSLSPVRLSVRLERCCSSHSL